MKAKVVDRSERPLHWLPRPWRGAPYIVACTSFLCAVALTAVLVHVEAAWQRATEVATGSTTADPSDASLLVADAFSHAARTQLWASIALFLLSPLLSVVVGKLWMRREQRAGRSAVVPAIVSTTVGLLLCSTAFGSFMSLVWQYLDARSGQTLEGVHAHFLDALGWLPRARVAVVVIAAAATVSIVGMAWQRQRRGGSSGPGSLPVGLGCLFVGGAFWLAARPLAHDASNPPAAWAAPLRLGVGVEVPARGACAALRNGPVVELRSGQLWVDGVAAGTVAGGPTEVRNLLKSKLDLSRAHGSSPVPAASFVASGTTPVKDLVPFLDAARFAGYREVDAWVARAPRILATRTRGTLVEPQPFCRVSFALDAPVPTALPWGGVIDHFVTQPGGDL